MSDESPRPEKGQSLLASISAGVVRLHKEFFGKGPTSAKSYFLDDMLIVVMKGGMTTAEHSMVDFGEEDRVRAFRQAFQEKMTGRLTRLVEEATGRRVVSAQSQSMFHPDRLVEMFVFEDRVGEDAAAATAAQHAAPERVGQHDEDDAHGSHPGPRSPRPPGAGE